jgi:hypothetical protein
VGIPRLASGTPFRANPGSSPWTLSVEFRVSLCTLNTHPTHREHSSSRLWHQGCCTAAPSPKGIPSRTHLKCTPAPHGPDARASLLNPMGATYGPMPQSLSQRETVIDIGQREKAPEPLPERSGGGLHPCPPIRSKSHERVDADDASVPRSSTFRRRPAVAEAIHQPRLVSVLDLASEGARCWFDDLFISG